MAPHRVKSMAPMEFALALGSRGPRGRNYCLRAWTVIATCAQQGRSVYEFICAAVAAAFHGTPIPSLRPAAP
jgi:transposase